MMGGGYTDEQFTEKEDAEREGGSTAGLQGVQRGDLFLCVKGGMGKCVREISCVVGYGRLVKKGGKDFQFAV